MGFGAKDGKDEYRSFAIEEVAWKPLKLRAKQNTEQVPAGHKLTGESLISEVNICERPETAEEIFFDVKL